MISGNRRQATGDKPLQAGATAWPSASVAALAERRWLLVVLGLGLALRLAFALQPLDRLLIWLEDDAWMVQAIARNFALGRGVSADGVSPTNGFHPLYPLLLGSIPYLFDARPLGSGLPLNMLLCALLNTLALPPLYGLVRRFAGALPALCSAALVALNLSIIRLSVNAMETSLALLMGMTLLWLFFQIDRGAWRAGLALGLLGGLGILARLDMVLLLGALGLPWAWDVARRRQPFPPLLAFGLASGAIFGLYLAVNQLVFGNPQPSSGRALAYMHSYADSFSLFNGLGIVSLNPLLPLPALGPAPIALAALAVAAGLSLWLIRGAARELLAVIAIYLLLVALYYGYLLQHLQPRYLVLLAALSAIWLGLLLRGLQLRLPRATAAVALAATLAVSGAAGLAALRFYERAAGQAQLTQPAMYEAARWMAANLPADAIIGAKNSGIYQFYSERTVVNLDGKLNGEMLAVFEQRDLLGYMQRRKIGYIIERDSVLLPWLAQYSAQLADTPPHHSPSLRERAQIYVQLALSRLGLSQPPALDEPYRGPVQADALLNPVASFARRNAPDDPVRLYRLRYP